MTELNLDQYDRDQTVAEIEASWSEIEGLVFPLLDAGVLVRRKYRNVKVEDFVGCFYLHTLMREVMQQSGLKLTGELINDPLYNKIIVATNTRSKVDVDNNRLYVGKSDNQVFANGASPTQVTFNQQSTPYFIGSDVAFTTSTVYVASSDMIVDISFTFKATGAMIYTIRVNGESTGGVGGTIFNNEGSMAVNGIFIGAGQTIDVICSFNITGGPITIESANLRVTPQFIYKAFGSSSVPLWTKSQFINEVFSMFNCVTDYDPFSKTVTANLFEKIKSKPPIDLSPYIDDTEIPVDYVEFISNYGQQSTLSYKDSGDEELLEYNISSYFKYGSGVIDIDNELIPTSAEIIDSEFTSPISYNSPAFNLSMEKINFVETEEKETEEITGTTNGTGDLARFTVDNGTTPDNWKYKVNDLVLIDTSLAEYNGEWIVANADDTYIELLGLNYNSAATGEVTKLIHKLSTDESVYLFVNVPDYTVSDMSKNDEVYLNNTSKSSIALAFFTLLNNDTQINEEYKQSLSFGSITDPLFYQRTLIDTFWSTAARVLNDPVKLTVSASLPESVYNELTPLSPIFIKTNETVNLYYVNRITGYYPCEIELIKLP